LTREAAALLAFALRAQRGGGMHAQWARDAVLALLLAQLLAAAGHDRPPHAHARAPRRRDPRRARVAHRESLAGRRPRG
jgi:hypothetical protein